MKRCFLPGLLFCFVVYFVLHPLDAMAADQAEQARSYFEEKKYGEALSIWYQLADAGPCHAGLFFNIGLGESSLNNTSKAMLAFEQALRLKPANKMIRSAIVHERKKIPNATIPVDSFFLSDWHKVIVTLLRPGYWALLGLVFLVFGFYWFKVKSAGQILRRISIYPVSTYMIVSGLIFVLMGFLSHKEIYRTDVAIVMESCDIRQAPTADSPLNKPIQPGEKVFINDEIGEWYHVQLLNIDEGWIQKKCLVVISIAKE